MNFKKSQNYLMNFLRFGTAIQNLLTVENKFLGAFAKLRIVTISFVMSVRPHGTTLLPMNGF